MSTTSTLAPPPPATSSSPSPSSIVVLADDHDVLGEGPIHDPRTGRLYRVDIEGKKVLSIDLKKKRGGEGEGEEGKVSASAVVGATPEAVGCLALTSDPNTLLVALSRSVRSLDVSTGELSEEPLAELPESEGVEGLRFNDGKVSPRGVFVVGRLHSKWRDGFKGAVYALKKNGSSSEWALERVLGPEEVGMGNGMAWRPRKAEERGTGETGEGGEAPPPLFDFFIVDSAAKTVQRFRTDPSTAVPTSGTGETVLDAADFGGATPDGMDVDRDGNLWVALAETGTVACLDPDARARGLPLSRRATLRLPLTRVTSCAFGVKDETGEGEDLSSTLFVTSREEASKLKEGEASPVAGAVLVVSDVAGAARIGGGGDEERKISAGCPAPAMVEL